MKLTKRFSTTTNLPTDYLLTKEKLISRSFAMAQDYSEEDLKFQQGDLVVYCEGSYMEDHRAALVVRKINPTTVQLRVQLNEAHALSFTGEEIELSSPVADKSATTLAKLKEDLKAKKVSLCLAYQFMSLFG